MEESKVGCRYYIDILTTSESRPKVGAETLMVVVFVASIMV